MNMKRTDYFKMPTLNDESKNNLGKGILVVLGVVAAAWLISDRPGLLYLAIILGVPVLTLYWIIRLAVRHGSRDSHR